MDSSIKSLSWRLVERARLVDGNVSWRAYGHFGDYTMRQLYHLINLAFDREILPAYRYFAAGQDIGLEFLVEIESGEKTRLDSDRDLVAIFDSSYLPSLRGEPQTRPRLSEKLKKLMRHQKQGVVEILPV